MLSFEDQPDFEPLVKDVIWGNFLVFLLMVSKRDVFWIITVYYGDLSELFVCINIALYNIEVDCPKYTELDVHKWSSQDVCSWLQDQGFNEVAVMFQGKYGMQC